MIKRGKNVTHILNIKIGDNNIRYKSEIKYLGIIIYKNMTWISHTNYVNDKVRKINYKLNSMSKVT